MTNLILYAKRNRNQTRTVPCKLIDNEPFISHVVINYHIADGNEEINLINWKRLTRVGVICKTVSPCAVETTF